MWATSTKDKENRLTLIAGDSGGYFTAKQALQVGYSYRLQSYHRNKGHWEDIDRGLFRLPKYPFSERDDLVRWMFWGMNQQGIPQVVVSHETALSVYELSDIMPAKFHFTVPLKFRKNPPGGCILHKATLDPNEVQKRDGFLITKPLKTLIDVTEEHLSLDYLEQAIREALQRGLVNQRELQEKTMTKDAKEKIQVIFDNIKKRPS